MLRIDLQLFAQGGDGGGAAASQGVAQGADTGGHTGGLDAAIQAYEESKKPGGKPFDGSKYLTGQTAQTEQTLTADINQDTPAEGKPSFKDLLKEYKQEADEYIQGIVKERLKNSKDAEKMLKDIQPMLDMLADSRGIKKGDIKALKEAVLSDAKVYEDEAMKQGVPVETVMQMKQLELEAQESRERLREIEAEAAAARFVTDLVRQGEELKAKFPHFDLRAVMASNEKFAELVMEEQMDVETAFKATHFDEIMGFERQRAMEEARSGISRSIQSGAQRPIESAARPGGQSAQMSIDPRNLSDEQFKDILNRVRRGENVTL